MNGIFSGQICNYLLVHWFLMESKLASRCRYVFAIEAFEHTREYIIHSGILFAW